MAHAPGDAHEYPIWGGHFRVVFPIYDADGDLVTGATGLDSERSIDCGTFADCTNEATEIATASGMYYLDLTGAEMTCSVLAVIIKTTSGGAKTTPITLYPKRTPILESGTAQAGAAGTITLASGASTQDDYYNGLYVLITNDSPAGARYQVREIVDYVGSTRVATIESAWGTNPSSASTYDIIIPETTGVAAWAGVKLAQPTTAGLPNVTTTANSDKTGYTASTVSDKTGYTVSTVSDKTGYSLSAGGVQAIWDALSSALTTANSIGKRLVDYLTGDAYARLGAPVNASISADIAANKTVVDAIKVRTDLTPEGIKKNTARANFTFVMTDSTTHAAKTGLVNGDFTKKYRLDNGAASNLSGTITEVSSTDFPGLYSIDLTAGELNGDMVAFRFSASGADTLEITIKTSQ
jgi:hypothetical protein